MSKIKVFINRDLPHPAGSGGIMPNIRVCRNEDLPHPAGKRDFVFEALHKPADDWEQEFGSNVDAYLNRTKGKLDRISSTVVRRRRKIDNNP
jgi:hypothetical protein